MQGAGGPFKEAWLHKNNHSILCPASSPFSEDLQRLLMVNEFTSICLAYAFAYCLDLPLLKRERNP